MTVDRLAAQIVVRRSGQEPFLSSGQVLSRPQYLLDFWQWSASDLLVNTVRSLIAEYLVALAVGVADTPRVEWDPYDLKTPAGLKIEVKSSARFQSWLQTRPSPIEFDIAKKQLIDAANQPVGEARRHADIYVFCLLDHVEAPLDPLNLDHWTFYILPTAVLDARMPEQKKVRLSSLQALHPEQTRFEDLKETIDRLAPLIPVPR